MGFVGNSVRKKKKKLKAERSQQKKKKHRDTELVIAFFS
jgi:hypothetical protein